MYSNTSHLTKYSFSFSFMHIVLHPCRQNIMLRSLHFYYNTSRWIFLLELFWQNRDQQNSILLLTTSERDFLLYRLCCKTKASMTYSWKWYSNTHHTRWMLTVVDVEFKLVWWLSLFHNVYFRLFNNSSFFTSSSQDQEATLDIFHSGSIRSKMSTGIHKFRLWCLSNFMDVIQVIESS